MLIQRGFSTETVLDRSDGRAHHRGSRFSAGVEAVLHLRNNDIQCRAHNISRTGTLITGVLPPTIDLSVQVTFRLPQGGFETRLPAHLVRLGGENENGERELALEFDSLEGKDHEDLGILVARVVEGSHPGPIELLKPGAPAHEIRAALEQVPMAHRIALAARAKPRERELLLHDTKPQVLEALARNPGLLVQQARELAANRELLGTTLEVLARDPRWATDEELQIRIVTHPRVPLPLAEKMTKTMTTATLRKLVQRPGVPPLLRNQLMQRLARAG